MNFSDSNWNRINDGNQRSIPTRHSLLSLQATEEPSFSSSSNNSHLNKTLSKLIDRFDIYNDDQSAQENQRQKDRLLSNYNDLLTR